MTSRRKSVFNSQEEKSIGPKLLLGLPCTLEKRTSMCRDRFEYSPAAYQLLEPLEILKQKERDMVETLM